MSSPTASLLIRDLPHYRREVFTAGLARCGFAVVRDPKPLVTDRDVLVIWNRYGANDTHAKRYERAGAAVIVAENGYLDFVGAKKTFAISLNHHNGAGDRPEQAEQRSHMLGVELKPWRGDGAGIDDILLLPQRGIGPPGVAMPRFWQDHVQTRLKKAGSGRRRIRVRPHPGTQKVRPVEEALDGVGLCVTWGSGAGIKTLIAGIPTMFEFPDWIGGIGGSFGTGTLTTPRLGDRERMLENVAWAQWTAEEVESGEALRRLLERRKELA